MKTSETKPMTAKHAPTPWNAQPTAGHDVHGQSAVYAEVSGKTVAIVYDSSEDAAFIVAACNSHETLLAQRDQLLEAARFLLSRLDDGSGQQMRVYSDTLHPDEDSKTVVDLLREAIHAAGGER